MKTISRWFDLVNGEGYEPHIVQFARQLLIEPGRIHNPMFVLGPRRSGKSQYLRGISDGLSDRLSTVHVKVTKASEFRREYLESYQKNQRGCFARLYQDRPALLIDDLQELADSPESLAALATIANTLLKAHKPLVFTSSWTPRNLDNFLVFARSLAPQATAIRLTR